ncbi:MAG: hypothetical protein CMD23_02040 [Flavobacteriales bacterium]|nr:hypothetical protein [Flavobacteriales bacterium]|tara:strand:- start:595 stop:1869 length:1275 start_codon:yes stop_codon:yes gene_type:complete
MIHFFKKTYHEVVSSNYFKNLFVLTSGVGLAQLIPFLLLPILTRFFTPTDFGVFAVFMAIIQLLAIPMTLRLEMAVVLPKKDTDAALLCFMSLVSLVFFSLLSLLSLFVCDLLDLNFDVFSGFEWVLYLIPVGIVMLGVYNILYSWNNRLELYQRMSYSHILHSTFSTPVAIGFYFTPIKPVALIIGQVIGRCLACILLFNNLIKTIQKVPYDTISSHCFSLLKEYRKFIIFEAPHSVLNFLSQKYILGVFTAFFGMMTVGIFDLADKIIGKPLGILSNSFKTVFYKRLTTAKDKLSIFKKSLFLITFASLFLTAPFYIVPDSFFIFLLGPEWADTGKYIQLICPLLFSRFIFNVVSPTISYTLQNHFLLIWQIIYIISLILLFWFIAGYSVENVLLYYALFGACMYAVLGMISFIVLKNHIKN